MTSNFWKQQKFQGILKTLENAPHHFCTLTSFFKRNHRYCLSFLMNPGFCFIFCYWWFSGQTRPPPQFTSSKTHVPCAMFLQHNPYCGQQRCLVAGMVGSRSQGQVTSSSEIGLGNGQPGNTMGQASLGQGQQPTKDVTPGETNSDPKLSAYYGHFFISFYGLLQPF